jgi:hypothetical protein
MQLEVEKRRLELLLSTAKTIDVGLTAAVDASAADALLFRELAEDLKDGRLDDPVVLHGLRTQKARWEELRKIDFALGADGPNVALFLLGATKRRPELNPLSGVTPDTKRCREVLDAATDDHTNPIVIQRLVGCVTELTNDAVTNRESYATFRLRSLQDIIDSQQAPSSSFRSTEEVRKASAPAF